MIGGNGWKFVELKIKRDKILEVVCGYINRKLGGRAS